MFKKILVGYDGTEQSGDALAFARAIGGEQAQVTAACSYWYEPMTARIGGTNIGEGSMRDGAERVLSDLPPEVVRLPAPGASPAAALHELLETGDYDLVVVGSTHRGAAGRVLAGTTAERLLQGSPRPVAVPPRGYRDRARRLGRVGVAYGGGDESRAALEVGRQLAEPGAELLVLAAFSTPVPIAIGYGVPMPDEDEMREAVQRDLDQAIADHGAPGTLGELIEGPAGPGLVEASERLDVLVMGSRGYGPLRRVLLGSVSSHVMRHAHCPVVVVPRSASADAA